MAQITLTIPNNKLLRVTNAIAGVYPIPTDNNGDPLFTDGQWAKEAVRRHIRDVVFRWERKEAIAALTIELDDSIVT